jgi:hypothetical protein
MAPESRRMDSKSDSEEMIYPYVCFSVDNFDEAFGEIQVRTSELFVKICILTIITSKKGMQ